MAGIYMSLMGAILPSVEVKSKCRMAEKCFYIFVSINEELLERRSSSSGLEN
jgi:hypothetical protein